ncbi:TPA: hypothetical protein I7730_01450 [Vibrio vulnificus]|uniref:Cadherin domain-containing protein n=1 Tax=Vibrio vulnificus TaxID=672 RepID=A0A8H9K737_VIBVL|nr:hypothetical protein [Vibrio vulnificus]HAS8538462.1 hypothetical protein [Vibrio vulnificus]
MKRFPFNSILFAIALSGSGAAFAVTPTHPSVDGEISNLAELRWLSQNSSAWTRDWALVADIDASDTKNWNSGMGFLPIGTQEVRFDGSFDGGGHTISGLFINRPDTKDVGLFGYIQYLNTVSNLTILDADITGGMNVGVLAGTILKTENKNVKIIDSKVHGGRAGGYAGYPYNLKADNIHIENIKVVGSGDSGGFGGYIENLLDMTNIHVSGVIESKSRAGGLIGFGNNLGTWDGVTVDVTVDGKFDVGGVLGHGNNGRFTNISVTGDISSSLRDSGGLVGNVGRAIKLSNCSFSGTVTGVNSVGGVIGSYFHSGTEVIGCTVDAKITGEKFLGGIAGVNSGMHMVIDGVSILEGTTLTGDSFIGGFFGIGVGGYLGYQNLSSKATLDGNWAVGGFVGGYYPMATLSFNKSGFDGSFVKSGSGVLGSIVDYPIENSDFDRINGVPEDVAILELTDSFSISSFSESESSALVSSDLRFTTLNLTNSYVAPSLQNLKDGIIPKIHENTEPNGAIESSYYISKTGGLDALGFKALNAELPLSTTYFSGFSFATPWKNGVWGFDHVSERPFLNPSEVPVFTSPNLSDGDLSDLEVELGDSITFSVNAIMESTGSDTDVLYELTGNGVDFATIDEFGLITISPTNKSMVGEHEFVVTALHGDSKNSLMPFKVSVNGIDDVIDNGDVDTGDTGTDDTDHIVIDLNHNVNLSGGSTGPLTIIALLTCLALARRRV